MTDYHPDLSNSALIRPGATLVSRGLNELRPKQLRNSRLMDR